ncbi:hypothetical protein ACN9M0_12170 [Streptomyces sp. R-07]|uniref:hypothetical protein n=1 Tax=Streptomyces sp. R-07 TaxID=3404052 RepID=UPI003CE7FB4B
MITAPCVPAGELLVRPRMWPSVVLVLVVAVLVLLAGFAANGFLRPRLLNEGDDTGMAVKDLVGPLLTLTVLLLAFVLVTANGSYGKAEVASRGEARALDQLVETAEYAPRGPAGADPGRRRLLRPRRPHPSACRAGTTAAS